MTEAAKRKAAGWPPRLRDCRGLKVRTRRQIDTMQVSIPAGAPGVIETSGNGWHLLQFKGDPCSCCGVAPRFSRASWTDFEVIRD